MGLLEQDTIDGRSATNCKPNYLSVMNYDKQYQRAPLPHPNGNLPLTTEVRGARECPGLLPLWLQQSYPTRCVAILIMLVPTLQFQIFQKMVSMRGATFATSDAKAQRIIYGTTTPLISTSTSTTIRNAPTGLIDWSGDTITGTVNQMSINLESVSKPY